MPIIPDPKRLFARHLERHRFQFLKSPCSATCTTLPVVPGQSWIVTNPETNGCSGLTTFTLPIAFAPAQGEMAEYNCHLLCPGDAVIQVGFLSIPQFPINDGSIGVGDITGSVAYDPMRSQFWKDGLFYSLSEEPGSNGDTITLRIKNFSCSIYCNEICVKSDFDLMTDNSNRIWFPAISLSSKAACVVDLSGFFRNEFSPSSSSLINWKDEYFGRIVKLSKVMAKGSLDEIQGIWEGIMYLTKHPLDSEIPILPYAFQLLFSYPNYHERDKVLGSSSSIEDLKSCSKIHITFLIKYCQYFLSLSLTSASNQQILRQFLSWLSAIIDQTLISTFDKRLVDDVLSMNIFSVLDALLDRGTLSVEQSLVYYPIMPSGDPGKDVIVLGGLFSSAIPEQGQEPWNSMVKYLSTRAAIRSAAADSTTATTSDCLDNFWTFFNQSQEYGRKILTQSLIFHWLMLLGSQHTIPSCRRHKVLPEIIENLKSRREETQKKYQMCVSEGKQLDLQLSFIFSKNIATREYEKAIYLQWYLNQVLMQEHFELNLILLHVKPIVDSWVQLLQAEPSFISMFPLYMVDWVFESITSVEYLRPRYDEDGQIGMALKTVILNLLTLAQNVYLSAKVVYPIARDTINANMCSLFGKASIMELFSEIQGSWEKYFSHFVNLFDSIARRFWLAVLQSSNVHVKASFAGSAWSFTSNDMSKWLHKWLDKSHSILSETIMCIKRLEAARDDTNDLEERAQRALLLTSLTIDHVKLLNCILTCCFAKSTMTQSFHVGHWVDFIQACISQLLYSNGVSSGSCVIGVSSRDTLLLEILLLLQLLHDLDEEGKVESRLIIPRSLAEEPIVMQNIGYSSLIDFIMKRTAKIVEEAEAEEEEEEEKEEIYKSDKNNICLICYERYAKEDGKNDGKRISTFHPCGHTSCSDCILRYFESGNADCFFCKRPIISISKS